MAAAAAGGAVGALAAHLLLATGILQRGSGRAGGREKAGTQAPWEEVRVGRGEEGKGPTGDAVEGLLRLELGLAVVLGWGVHVGPAAPTAQ